MPYLGQRPSKGDENNFKILDNISSYTLTFDGSDSAVVSAADDTITSLSHRFVQGQRVTYNKGGGTVIAGLSDGVYYIIKEDHNTIKLATSASNATNGIAVNITGVGGGSSHTLNVAFDGVNTKFKATHTNGQKAKITRSAQLVISMNGVIQQPHDTATPSTGFGFDLDGTIVFSQAPVSTDVYWAHVLTNNNVTFDISDNDVDNFTGNGNTVSFNLSKTPPDNRNVLVTIEGVVQHPNDPDGTVRAYNVVENVLTFTTAPTAGAEIQVRHIGFAGSTSGGGGSGVTNFYGRTGAVVLKNTDNIVANNAEFAGNLTVQGTMTTLDTKLTEVDQLEVAANNTTVGVAITQSGSGDILNLYDGSTEVFSVADGGKVDILSTNNLLTLKKATNGNYCGFELDRDNSGTEGGTIGLAGGTGHFITSAKIHDLTIRSANGNILFGSGQTEVLRTNPFGAKVTGILTATTFVGNGDFVDIDVDGRADLDDVVITGVTTTTNMVEITGALHNEGANLTLRNTTPINNDENLANINVAANDGPSGFHTGAQIKFQSGNNWSDNATWTDIIFKHAKRASGTALVEGIKISGTASNVSSHVSIGSSALSNSENYYFAIKGYERSSQGASGDTVNLGIFNQSGAVEATANIDFRLGQAAVSNTPAARLLAGKEGGWTNTASTRDGYFAISVSNNAQLSEHFRINKYGRVGIGTNNPGGLLTVYGSPAELRLQHTGNSSYSRIISDSSNELKIYTGGGPHLAMTIDGSQRVGIGTDTIYSKLQVQDGGIGLRGAATPNINFSPTDGNSGNADISYDGDDLKIISNSSQADIRIAAYSKDNHIVIRPNGRVGIGTDDPTVALEIGKVHTDPMIRLNDPADRRMSIRGPSANHIASVGTETTHDLMFYTNGYSNERLRITSGGNIETQGLGTFEFNDGWSGEGRNIVVWPCNDVSNWFSFVGSNLRFTDGGNFVKPSDMSNNNWGNIAGIAFEGVNQNNSNGDHPAIRFVVDQPGENGANYSLGSGSSGKTAAIDNNTAAFVSGNGNFIVNNKICIGEDNPDSNSLLIRAASTVATKYGHIMLTGDSATVGQGPQIVFSESGSGSNYAGGYVGFLRTGSNSIGDLVFGTRATSGNADTVPTERLRIESDGDICIGRTSGLSDAKVSIQCDAGEAGIAVQLNTSSGASNLLMAYSSAGPNVASITVDPDASPGLMFNVWDGSTTAERVRIDNAGRVMFGTSTPGIATGDEFTIHTTGHTGMTIRSGNTHEGNIFFGDSDYGAAGIIRYEHNNNAMVFKTNSVGQERLRITSEAGASYPTSRGSLQLGGGSASYGFPLLGYNDSGTRIATHLCTGSFYQSTGMIIIKTTLPKHNTGYTMWSCRITGYAYSTNLGGAIDCVVGCYTGENNYYNPTVTGTYPNAWRNNISFATMTTGTHNGHLCIRLGTTSTQQLCEIAVTDFVWGYSSVSNVMAEGWQMVCLTSDSGYNTNAVSAIQRSHEIYNDEFQVVGANSGELLTNRVGRGGTIMGMYQYTQYNQGQNFEHFIRSPLGHTDITDQYANKNWSALITVGVDGTSTVDTSCTYFCRDNNDDNNSLQIYHHLGNSGSSSNRCYMVVNGGRPAWKMNHSGGYRVSVTVQFIHGGKADATYNISDTSYQAN